MTQPLNEIAHQPATILIVDDDPYIRQSLRELLRHDGHRSLEAADGKIALELLDRQPVDLMLLDLIMPRVNGMSVLRKTILEHPNLPVIIVSGKGDIPKAVEATRLGAYDFLEKPVDARRVLLTVRNALEKATLERQRNYLLEEARTRYRMIGSSPPMQQIYRLIDKASRANIRVLITGESGTGKECVAHAIHLNSPRAGYPFVPLNCAAIPADLIESELFGHEKGAFTGAHALRHGTFEQADGGTLLLDEIGDMSLMTQTKVLRVLEDGLISRVGAHQSIPVDVRIVAATNKNLDVEIEEGNFREDLYFRLNVIHIHLPPLRERWQDIPVLAEYFLACSCQEQGSTPKKLAPGALIPLSEHSWPGNVRQLRNIIERLVALSDGEMISAFEVEQALKQKYTVAPLDEARQATLRHARERFERQYILSTLDAHAWRIQDTAATLGITRGHLWKKMQQYGIEQAG